MKAFNFKSLAIGSKGIVVTKSIAVIVGISAATYGVVKVQEFKTKSEQKVENLERVTIPGDQDLNLSSAGFILEMDKLFNSLAIEDTYISNQENRVETVLPKDNDQMVQVKNPEPRIFPPLVFSKPIVKEEVNVGFEFTEEDLSYFEKFGAQRTIVPAFYEGGNEKLNEFLSSSISYPSDAMAEGIEGTVFVQFEIDCDGKIENVQTVKSVCESLDKEAERIVRLLPNWKPKQVNMENVPSLVQIPIKFDIQ